MAECHLELGDAEAARRCFQQAVELDPEGEMAERDGGGAEKFLWMAQLCEEGGEDSVQWFERGAAVLRREIAREEEGGGGGAAGRIGGNAELVEEKKKKLAGVLCGMIEVYMTDLSYSLPFSLFLLSFFPKANPLSSLSSAIKKSLDPHAESHCTRLISQALDLAPTSPTPHQTHASILISQSEIPAARAALRTSLSLWQHLPAAHADVPDFPSRISLARLLLEVGMEREAVGVMEAVVSGDESCVEGWYLGGWGLWSLSSGSGSSSSNTSSEGAVGGADPTTAEAEQQQQQQQQQHQGREDRDGGDGNHNDDEEEKQPEAGNALRAATTLEGSEAGGKEALLKQSLHWLRMCLGVYEEVEYEDERLRDHALELVAGIEKIIGVGGEDEEWEESRASGDDDIEEEDEDEDMKEG